MTSKADKKRRKIAQRKREPHLPPFEVGHAIREAAAEQRREKKRAKEDEEWDRRLRPTPKQERAWDWFYGLATSDAPEVPEQIKAARAAVTMEEFAVMSEDVLRQQDGSTRKVPYRIGHSATTTHDLRMSALRKLVIYRAMTGLDEREHTDKPQADAVEGQPEA